MAREQPSAVSWHMGGCCPAGRCPSRPARCTRPKVCGPAAPEPARPEVAFLRRVADGGSTLRGGRHRLSRRANLARACSAAALLSTTSCSQMPATSLDASKLALVVIGQSSRTDVFADLGRPDRTQQGSQGETWVYEAKAGDSGAQGLRSGAAAVSGIIGAFVPYAGLVGSGLGLADAAAGRRQEPDTTSVTISFTDSGIVRDCSYSSTALPAGVPGSAEKAAKVVGCQRPPLVPAASQAR